ncbi:MAG: COR domain-containing protein [Candidatus Aminicenantes bacterium]
MSKDIEIIKELGKKIDKNLSGRYSMDGMYGNKNIIRLNLSWLKISDITSLTHLKNLTYLDLQYSQISDISSLKDLKNLTHLDLEHNQISDISSLKDLKIVDLDLANNRISELLVEVSNWKGDLSIIFKGNPIEIPPMEIMKKGKKAVKAYFKSLEGKKRVLNEVKMLLVGDGGAGKTSLMKQLLGENFDKNEPQTHGININHWKIMHGNSKIKVNIWDFGGQEIMHATHQFFLSKRSLYVLVLDGRKDEKTEYWLKHVKSFGGDSPVLVVINKVDANPGFDVNRLFLQDKYKNIKGFFRVSCATGEGMENFSQKLIYELAKVDLINTTWPETWFNVKTQLEKMDEDFISYYYYKTLCQGERVITKISRDTLVDFLHDLGVVLHFKDFKLQETHVINPEWVTTAVYKIINSKDIAESKGLLKLNLLDDILKQEKDTDYYYPWDKYRYIIDLMQKFELCYEIDSETILIPDLLEIQEPSFDFDYATALKFQIQYDFLPRSIIPRFMVKMHKDIKAGLQWRTGVVLEDKAFHCIAVVKSDDEEKRIHIYVQGEQKRDYFAAILHTFREINSSFEKLEAIEEVPMPDNLRITVEYEHLVWLEKSGADTYAPNRARKFYNIRDLLGTVDNDAYTKLLTDLKNKFLALSELEPQKRGFEFEKFLNRLFELYDLNPRNSFKNTGEQIDGSFQMGSDIYLVEAKWQKNKIGQADLLVFAGKVSRKAKWTRGFFISMSGFSDDGQEAFSKGQPTSIIGMDGSDLEYILDRKFTLPEAISLKLRHAAETNEFFAPLPELKKRYADN